MQAITERESKSLNILKAFAILSVVAAHTVKIIPSPFSVLAVTTAWQLFGTVGVVIFFMLSGFFYRRELGDSKSFWLKKLKRIIIPWVIAATATYAVSVVLTRSFSLLSFVKWLFGYGSWFYYISVLLLFYALFRFVYRSVPALIALIVLNLCSLAAMMIFEDKVTGVYALTFLNPLNWCGYFALGVLIRKFSLHRALIAKRLFIVGFAAIGIIGAVLMALLDKQTYFNPFCMLFAIGISAVAYRIAYLIGNSRVGRLLSSLGGITYAIYLWHMQLVQPIAARLPQTALLVLLVPFICLCVVAAIFASLKFICNKKPALLKAASLLLGL